MGDTRIKISISKEVLSSAADEIVVKEYSADSSIRDARDDAFGSLAMISVWDCTLHPPKDITSWIFDEFPDKSGPKSKTLYDAGCFPSAVWKILPSGAKPHTKSIHEDTQYNLLSSPASNNADATTNVELLNQPKYLKPSQVLHSVTQRFGDENTGEATAAAHLVRRQKLQERRAKEAARHARLEGKIKKLKGIKSGTSEQVRKMLIKSRCSGSKSLKMQDRVYLQVALARGESMTEDFRYFSRQDTVARIVQTLASDAKSPQETELLISTSDQAFRRLPITSRLYEAIDNGWLKEVDSVVIRYFTPPEEEPTTSILDDAGVEGGDSQQETGGAAMSEEPDQNVSDTTDVVMNDSEHDLQPPLEQEECSSSMSLSQSLIKRLDSAITCIDAKSKKKSSTSTKVRQMLMKSKAKGDKKRTKMEERFFLELILLEGESTSSSYVFVSKRDTMARLLEEHCSASCVPYFVQGEGLYGQVPGEPTLESLEATNTIACFGRVVVIKE